MKNRYTDQDAHAMVTHYAARSVNEDVALRVYTSRLLGLEPALVQHGGGNTSVKTVVPYVKPGFDLSKPARDAHATHPHCEGLMLLKHGIFSFGATARESYDRMIALVTMAEAKLTSEKPVRFVPVKLPAEPADPATV